MTKYRQHILAGVFLAILLYVGVDWVYRDLLVGPIAERDATLVRLEDAIRDRRGTLLKARNAERALDASWRARSLPSDTEVARSLYQAWLWELIDHVGFTGPSVIPGTPLGRNGMVREFSFSVSGRGTIGQITKFLFEFYNAPHLHQMRSLVISPVRNTEQLDLSVTIRALSIRGVPRSEQLATEPYNRLASDSLADYDAIVQKNLFAIGSAPDATEFAFLNGIVSVDGRPTVTFDLQSVGERLELHEGDPLKIGPFEGTVAEIHMDDLNVIIESENEYGEVERWLLTLGEKLSEAHALPPGY